MRSRDHFIATVGVLTLAAFASGCGKLQTRTYVPPSPNPVAATARPSAHLPQYRIPLSEGSGLPEQPQFDPIQDLIEKAEAAFERGRESYLAGHLSTARDQFNAAINTILQSPVGAREDKRLLRAFDSLVDRIHRYEVEALRQGDGFAGRDFEPSPLDEIETLTFQDEVESDQQVVLESAGSLSSIPLVMNSRVSQFIKYFTEKRGRKTLEASSIRSGLYREMILRILDEENVPRELIFLSQAESAFRPRARSRAGALGLWQFMSYTGKEYGLDRNWWIDQRMNPEEATRAAAKYLRDLYTQFGDWYLAMAAYNCGPACVSRAIRRTGKSDFWELARRRALPRETRSYIPIIMSLAIIGKDPEKYGLAELDVEPAWTYDTVTVTEPTDLRLVAELVGTSLEEVRELNPSLLRNTTPKVPEYRLRIPLSTRDLFMQRIAMIPPEKRVYWRWHTVRHAETLSGIASKFGTSVDAIAEVNSLDLSQPLREAAALIIPMGTPRPGSGMLSGHVGDGRIHVVSRNQTLGLLAQRYGTSVNQLIAWNNLDGTMIRVGQKLIVGPEVAGRAGSGVHVVRRNESLSIIGQRYGASVNQLKAWNNLSSTIIHVGQRLRVGTATDVAPPSGSGVHVVRRNESLSIIGQRYGVSVNQLKAWNNLTGTVIRADQKLKVGKTVSAPSSRQPTQQIASTGSNTSSAGSTPKRRVHRVRRGDSLWGIATNYKTSVAVLRRNNRHLGRTLQIGDSVYIPASE